MTTVRIIGPGRAGSSLATALSRAGWDVRPTLGRGDDLDGAAADTDLLLIATPDHAIAEVAAAVARAMAQGIARYFADADGTALVLPPEPPRAVSVRNDDQEAGINIVRRALHAPIRQIAENAGVEGSIVVGKVLENSGATFGFNAQTEEYGDLVAMGVIDPAKVVRTALQDAASVAGILITTEAAVADAPKKASGGGAPDMGGMGGGMGGMDF